MTVSTFNVDAVRRRFSALGYGRASFDSPAGSKVPNEVGQAIARTASGPSDTALEDIRARARADAGRLLGCPSEDVIFGPNMTSMNFALTRTASREWHAGDRILVSRLDHDAGVAPWIELAADRGFEVDWVDVTDDLRLDLVDLERKLDDKVRVVAFVWAANAVGTVTDAQRVTELAHDAGALAWIDAVHYAPHESIDVQELGCDILVCSAYKFCGPHLGIAYGRHDLLESWRPYKARPAPTSPVGARFETGMAPYELLAGFSATMTYLDSLGGIAAVRAHERELGARFLAGLPDNVTVYGLQTMADRVPTFLFNVDGVEATDVAGALASRGFDVMVGDNWYSLGLRDRLPYERGAIRIGFIHYNTVDEVDRFVDELTHLAR